jgi:hypothetical protein
MDNFGRRALWTALLAAAVSAAPLPGWLPPAGRTVAQEAPGEVTISIAPMILVEPGVETPLPIQLAASGPLPRNSFIRLRGLPTAAKLSEGHLVAAGSWAVPVAALPSLRIAAPVASGTRSELSVSLVGVDGTVWAEATATFAVIPAAAIVADRERPAGAPTTVATAAPAQGLPAPAGPALSGPAPRPAAGRPAPAIEPGDQQRARNLVLKGNAALRDGDVAGARLYFQRAAELGLAQAAFALAETYDPNELVRLGVRGLQPDPASARQWYERAQELGAAEASGRLQRLGAR